MGPPRRSGKTTILRELSQKLGVKVFNFDFSSDHSLFAPKRDTLDKLTKNNKIILIDEVQNYPQATVVLKILYDEYKVKVIATGSSELRQKDEEFDSQAGRFTEHYCLPLSIDEIKTNSNLPSYEESALEKRLAEQLQVFGSYPEVYAADTLSDEDKAKLLENIVQTYVLKDIVDIYELKNKKLAEDILTKIALLMGKEKGTRKLAYQILTSDAPAKKNAIDFVRTYVKPESQLNTDGSAIYKNIDKYYPVSHMTDIHKKFEFTNTSEIEGMFGVLRTFIRRMYHHINEEKLEEYVCEFYCRFSRPEMFKSPSDYLLNTLHALPTG